MPIPSSVIVPASRSTSASTCVRRRAERHPDADLPGPLRHQIGHHAVQTGGGQAPGRRAANADTRTKLRRRGAIESPMKSSIRRTSPIGTCGSTFDTAVRISGVTEAASPVVRITSVTARSKPVPSDSNRWCCGRYAAGSASASSPSWRVSPTTPTISRHSAVGADADPLTDRILVRPVAASRRLVDDRRRCPTYRRRDR